MNSDLFSAIATAVSSKAAELAVQSGKDACVALMRLIRSRFRGDGQAEAALEAARSGAEPAVAALAQALERLASQDAAFAARIKELWPPAAAELSVSGDAVVNSVTGSVGGHLMQSRDVRVDGGLHFGDVRSPSEG
jgi:hypothetical protein